MGKAEYRKHFSDLEQLIFKEFQTERGSKAWKAHLTSLKGAAKEGMQNPHARHILFKNGLGEGQQTLLKEGQDLLQKVGIDPLFGEEALYWAPNGVKDQHSEATLLKLIVDFGKIGWR